MPVVGLLFNITSTVGAALWASNLEKKRASYSNGRTVDKAGQSVADGVGGRKEQVRVVM